MPPRDPSLPEGTDQIINGAMETGAGAGASTGSSGGTGLGGGGFGGTGSGGTTPGGSADFAGGSGFTSAAGTGTTGSGGFIGAGGGATDDTGGFASGGSTGRAGASEEFGGSALSGSASAGLGTSSGGSSGGFGGGGSDLGGGGSGGFGGMGGTGGMGDSEGGSGGGVKQQVKSQVQNLQGQATDKVRSYAVDGKQKATTALTDLSQVVNEAAQSIDERLGPQYGDYARRAASAVSGFADTIDRKDVDELFDDARELIRKSPGVAIGAAAVLGFTLVRLVKAGMPDQQSTNVQFQPDSSLTTGGSNFGGSTGSSGTSPSGSTTTGSQAPYVAPTNTGV